MTGPQSARRASELVERGIPFVQATVVRAQCPTSARPGDSAVVLADGTIEGFVGGQCAEGSVRTASLPLLDSGEALLLRVLPDGGPQDDGGFPESEGALTVVNPCLSGGAIEVFLEPKLPAARIAIIGNTPIAASLELLAGLLGFTVTRSIDEPEFGASVAVLIASHGRDEETLIRRALDGGVGFVGLVASAIRGEAVVDSLGLDPEAKAVVHTPVGVDIGAKTAEEIALSILADVVRSIRLEGLRPPKPTPVERPVTARDPVCGMEVTVVDDTPNLTVDGEHFWFCNPGCRTRYAEEAAAV